MAKGEIARFVTNNVFKKPSAAEASENVYMRERVKSACETEEKISYEVNG